MQSFGNLVTENLFQTKNKKMKRGKFIERARHSHAHRDAPITFKRIEF